MRLFVGLDASLEKTAVCVLSEHGKIVKEAEVASDPEALALWIVTQPGSIAAVGLEAGPLSQWLHRGLSVAGLDVVLMETRQVKDALKAMPISEADQQMIRDEMRPKKHRFFSIEHA